jgi:hypothetical protein
VLEVGDALVGSAHRGLAGPEQAIRMRGAILRDPQVVGVHAGVLVVEVLVIAEDHSDRRVDDLTAHAVAILVGDARVRVPTAAVEFLELHAEDRDLLGLLAGGGNEAERHRRLHARDHEEIAALVVGGEIRRSVAVLGVDPVDIGVGGLGDVRVGRHDGPCH